MPTHVYANASEIASKASDGVSIASFPDPCFSPPAPPSGPMPLPYPNTAKAEDMDKGTTKVFICGKMVGMEDTSYISKSVGNEAATQNFQKGLVSGAIQGKAFFVNWSPNVKMEGKSVPRHMDQTTHNHGSTENTKTQPFTSSASNGSIRVIGKKSSTMTTSTRDIGIFFDGTDCDKEVVTSTQLRTNVAKLFDLYCEDMFSHKIYIRGVGTRADSLLDPNGKRIDNKNILSSGTGRGAEGAHKRIIMAQSFVNSFIGGRALHETYTVRFDLFGFSRGAALARHFARGLETEKEQFYTENIYKDTVNVEFVGLFDSVASILFGGKAGEGPLNLELPSSLTGKVYQVTAAHEYRKHFPLRSVKGVGEEDEICGSHSDIGGGQVQEEHSILLAKINSKEKFTPGADPLVNHLYALVKKYTQNPPRRFTFNPNNDLRFLMKTVADNSGPFWSRKTCIDFYILKRKLYSPYIEYATLFMMFTKALARGCQLEVDKDNYSHWQEAYQKVKGPLTGKQWDEHVYISAVNNSVRYLDRYEYVDENGNQYIRIKQNLAEQSYPKVKFWEVRNSDGKTSSYILKATIHGPANKGNRQIYENDGSERQ